MFELKTVIFALIFVCSFFSVSRAMELNIPLPENSFKVSERALNVGIIQSHIATYGSWLPQKNVTDFYKKVLKNDGWKEQEDGYYTKDSYVLMVKLLGPYINMKGKSRFNIIVSRIPSQEEVAAMRKEKPDKLSFMPVYPGSEQVFLTDTKSGAIASYETKNSIKEVVFFYKSSMLNYGWALGNESPVTEPKSGALTKTTLIFKRENESCRIEVLNLAKTKISVSYHAPYKKTKK